MGVAIGPLGSLLLILDVERPWKERQHLSWAHQSAAPLGVVPIKQLEPRVLDRIPLDVASVGLSLPTRRAPAIHIDHDLYPWIDADTFGVLEHVSGEAVDDEHLRRQRIDGDETVEEVDRLVHVRRIETADACPRRASVTHRELRIQAKMHVGAPKKRHQTWKLSLKRAPAELNVQKEQRTAAVR